MPVLNMKLWTRAIFAEVHLPKVPTEIKNDSTLHYMLCYYQHQA
jgi:hypothetical protein